MRPTRAGGGRTGPSLTFPLIHSELLVFQGIVKWLLGLRLLLGVPEGFEEGVRERLSSCQTLVHIQFQHLVQQVRSCRDVTVSTVPGLAAGMGGKHSGDGGQDSPSGLARGKSWAKSFLGLWGRDWM